MRVFLKYNYIQVDNTCYKDLQTLASGYKVEYVLYVFISPAIFFYLFCLFSIFFLCFNALNHLMKKLIVFRHVQPRVASVCCFQSKTREQQKGSH